MAYMFYLYVELVQKPQTCKANNLLLPHVFSYINVFSIYTYLVNKILPFQLWTWKWYNSWMNPVFIEKIHDEYGGIDTFKFNLVRIIMDI